VRRLVLVLVALAIAACASVAPAPGARHLVLISLDALRPEFYLDPAFDMPTLRALAAQGSHARAVESVFPSVTYPSHATIVTGVRPEDALYRNETFGPLVSVMRFSTFDEAVELANGHGYGLSSAIYTSTPKSVWDFRARVSAGMLSVNNSTSGAEAHLPFGGNGKSGNGSRQSGVWVLDQFTRWQSMNWDYAGKLQKAQMDTEASLYDPGFTL
jgi:hypothetical protein